MHALNTSTNVRTHAQFMFGITFVATKRVANIKSFKSISWPKNGYLLALDFDYVEFRLFVKNRTGVLVDNENDSVQNSINMLNKRLGFYFNYDCVGNFAYIKKEVWCKTCKTWYHISNWTSSSSNYFYCRGCHDKMMFSTAIMIICAHPNVHATTLFILEPEMVSQPERFVNCVGFWGWLDPTIVLGPVERWAYL